MYLYLLFDLPEKHQEESGRGTEINLQTDQLRVFDYWAQAGRAALVGVSLQVDNHTVEYWMPMTIDPIADEPLDTYLVNLQIQWQNRIREMSPCISQCSDNAGMSFTFRMRYQGNTPRVWFTPEEVAAAGIDKPLAEVPIVKDISISNEAEVLTCLPMSEDVVGESAQILFGGAMQGVRYSNTEVAGCHIALSATNNNSVQVPPPALDGMNASLQKQIAFNRRVFRAEEQIAGNVGLDMDGGHEIAY
jgi:hypothetical protein